MSHLVRYSVPVEAADFQDYWKKTVAYNRDGCTDIKIYRIHDGKYTPAVMNRFRKHFGERESPSSYQVRAYCLGISHWEVWNKAIRIVNHKRTPIVIKTPYKSKPKRIRKNGVLKTFYQYIIDYDVREYDPREHC